MFVEKHLAPMQILILRILQIYGKCPPSTLQLIKPSFNCAVKRSLRAHRTTRIDNMLAEGGVLPIEAHVNFLRCSAIHKLATNKSNILSNDIKLLQVRKTQIWSVDII